MPRPRALSRFWCEVLGYVELDRDGADVVIGPKSGFGGAVPIIVFELVTERNTGPLRLHLDVSPVDRE